MAGVATDMAGDDRQRLCGTAAVVAFGSSTATSTAEANATPSNGATDAASTRPLASAFAAIAAAAPMAVEEAASSTRSP